ncbi:MAG: hypothetical protein CL967_01155 [Euryarchaeota archaeon]|nr:hypothetical protein [Euryarchaeota archaeon]|tara:strand:- start:396 stop:860 length:465 start_codon:yes stop_codon:yes gene_type:complete
MNRSLFREFHRHSQKFIQVEGCMSDFTFLGQKIPKLTMLVGGILVLEGIGFYFATGMTSFTSMIPAAFGIPLIAMSIMATRQPERSHFWMHIAVVFGLLTFLGGGMGLQGLASGDYSESTIAQLLMLVIGGVYTFACIRSFTHARKAREAANQA